MPPLPPPRAIDVGLAIRRAVGRALDACAPAYAVAWEQSMGIARTQVMGAVQLWLSGTVDLINNAARGSR